MNHIPVLSQEILEYLAITPHNTYVDATIGAAGHSRLIAERLSEKGTYAGFDADERSIENAQHSLSGLPCAQQFIHANFSEFADELRAVGITKINGALFDLGWNMDQFEDASRGFSFRYDGPLDMRYGESSLTASDLVNTLDAESLARIIYVYGDESYSRRIARAIIEEREKAPIETTLRLANIIADQIKSKRFGFHPATKTFQALRIAVNDEYGVIEKALPEAWNMMEKGGRLLVITFHSGEDRIVKELFKNFAATDGHIVVKKGVTASDHELSTNPRSRSARLRIIEKL